MFENETTCVGKETLTPNTNSRIHLLRRPRRHEIEGRFIASIRSHLRAAQSFRGRHARKAHEAVRPQFVLLAGRGGAVPVLDPGVDAERVVAGAVEAVVEDVLALGEGFVGSFLEELREGVGDGKEERKGYKKDGGVHDFEDLLLDFLPL